MKWRLPWMVAMAAVAVLAGCCDRCSCGAAKPKCAKAAPEAVHVYRLHERE